MRASYVLSLLLASFGIILFVAGSSIIGRFTYNIQLSLTMTASGAILVAVAGVIAIISFSRKKSG